MTTGYMRKGILCCATQALQKTCKLTLVAALFDIENALQLLCFHIVAKKPGQIDARANILHSAVTGQRSVKYVRASVADSRS